MEPNTMGKRMVSNVPDRKQAILIHRGQHKAEPPLNSIILRWLVTMSICLVIWAVLSPLFYEQFYFAAARTGDFMNWLFWLACFLFPLLLVSVSSTRKVIVESRNQYFPPTNTNTAGLSASDSLVRASEEPLQAQEAVLLRAAAEGQETPPEQLVRAAEGQE